MENVQVHQIRVGPSWMDPLVLFLKEGVLPHEKGEAKKKNTEESSLFLVVRGVKVVQMLFLWTILALCSSRGSGAIFGRVAREDIWKSYGGQIVIT